MVKTRSNFDRCLILHMRPCRSSINLKFVFPPSFAQKSATDIFRFRLKLVLVSNMIGAPILQLLGELSPADESLRDRDNETREEGLEKLSAIKSALHVMKNPEIKRQLNKQSNKLGIILNYLLNPYSSK